MCWCRTPYFLFAKRNRGVYNPLALGHSLMVEHRTLTPLVLVRIQLPQPKIQTPFWVFLFLVLGRKVRTFATNVAKGSKPSRFAKQRARKSLRVARSRHPCRASESSCHNHTLRLRRFVWRVT